MKAAVHESSSCIQASCPEGDRHTALEERVETQAGIIMSKDKKNILDFLI